MKTTYLTGPAIVCGLLLVGAVPASAATPAKSTVTIKAQGTDLSGVVKSPKPKRCADGRTVVVYQQKGARGGGNDVRFASDTASLNGGVYAWSTGNTGTEGKFYAVVKAKTGCKADKSPTITAVRNP